MVGLAAGVATGSERIPDMVAAIPSDAHEENRKKRKSNDLRQFYEGEIIQEIHVINDEHDRRRQRTEAGSSSGGNVAERRMMESGGGDSGVVGRKRCREEGAATREEDRGQGKGIGTARARIGRAGMKKVVKLAEVVDELRGRSGSVCDGVTRGKSVQWVGGRWHIEVDEGGERGNSGVSGGASTDVRLEIAPCAMPFSDCNVASFCWSSTS